MNWRLYFQNLLCQFFGEALGLNIYLGYTPRLAQKLFDIFDTLQFLFFFAHHAQGARSVWGGLG